MGLISFIHLCMESSCIIERTKDLVLSITLTHDKGVLSSAESLRIESVPLCLFPKRGSSATLGDKPYAILRDGGYNLPLTLFALLASCVTKTAHVCGPTILSVPRQGVLRLGPKASDLFGHKMATDVP
jgi:hypothetical protein